MKEDKSKLLAIVLALVTIIVIVVSIFLKKENNEDNIKNAHVLNNPSQFFTVNSCLYRTITYAYKKDSDSLIKILDSGYKQNNKVNLDNVLTVFPTIKQDSTFVSKKMYYKEISKSLIKYYGEIRPNIIHDYTPVEEVETEDVYFIVNLDSSKQIFSVEPYDGKIFMEGEKNE